MYPELDFATAVEKAAHLQAIGIHRLHLDVPERIESLPWDLVYRVETGGSYRLGIPVSLRFEATHGPTGLRFSWHVDMEERSANGAGEYRFDTAKLQTIAALLPADRRTEYVDAIRPAIDKMRELAEDYQRRAGRMFADAAILGQSINQAAARRGKS